MMGNDPAGPLVSRGSMHPPENSAQRKAASILKRKSYSMCKEDSKGEFGGSLVQITDLGRHPKPKKEAEVPVLSPVRICSKGEVSKRDQLTFQIGQRAIQRTKVMGQCPSSISSLRKLAAKRFLSDLINCEAEVKKNPGNSPQNSFGPQDRSSAARSFVEKNEGDSAQSPKGSKRAEQAPLAGNSHPSPDSLLAQDSWIGPEQTAREIPLLQRTKADVRSMHEFERKSFRIGSLSPKRAPESRKKGSFEIRFLQKPSSNQLDTLDDSASPIDSPNTGAGPKQSKFANNSKSQARLISPIKVQSVGGLHPEGKEELSKLGSSAVTARHAFFRDHKLVKLNLDRIPGFPEFPDSPQLSNSRRGMRPGNQARANAN